MTPSKPTARNRAPQNGAQILRSDILEVLRSAHLFWQSPRNIRLALRERGRFVHSNSVAFALRELVKAGLVERQLGRYRLGDHE